jgi:hypothetical protein
MNGEPTVAACRLANVGSQPIKKRLLKIALLVNERVVGPTTYVYKLVHSVPAVAGYEAQLGATREFVQASCMGSF